MSGIRAFDRQPVASTTNFAVDRLAVGGRRPTTAIGRLVEHGALDAGVELDVRPQVEAVGDMVGVFQNLRLRRVALAPVPFLLQFFGERIGILHALDVAARAGIAVPVPGAADARALLDRPAPSCPARAAGAACTCRQNPRRPRRHRRSRRDLAETDGMADMKAGSLIFSLIWQAAFLPQRQSARRKSAWLALHILRVECDSW